MKWKSIKDKSGLVDDQNYLVCWIDAEGDCSAPSIAYWSKYDKKFFLLHDNHSMPVVVDAYCEIPKVTI